MAYSQTVKEEFWRLRRNGWSQRQAANRIGIAEKTATAWERADPYASKIIKEQARQAMMPPPKRPSVLHEESQRALVDFAYWRQRYLARRSVPWQIEAAERIVGWLASDQTEYIVMNCPPGCVSGDTIVTINRGGAARRIRVEDLWHRFNGGVAGGKVWRDDIPTMIARNDGGYGRLGEVAAVWDSGVKETFTIITDHGETIRATATHPFARPDGTYTQLGDLAPGDEVLVNVGQGATTRALRKRYASTYTRHHPNQRVAKGGFRYWTHRLVMEAHLNGVSFEDYIDALRHHPHRVKEFVFLSVDDVVHHIDDDHLNNDLDNLALTTHGAHHRLHASPEHVLYRIGSARITSIERYGFERTYDISLVDEPHNFIADGFVVHNSGKSTLWTDLMAWLVCRDRSIRILFGSRTVRLAEQPVNRVRRLLERTRPVADALHTVAEDYGRFKPEVADLWRRTEFTVLALDELPLEDKEPTITAYGMESEFLGHRGDLVLWDDLVVGSTLKNKDQIEAQQKWWEETGSTRVEPGGALVLNGQRMGPDDLYRYSLDQRLEDTDESRWNHVVYPAHFDADCKGDEFHKTNAPAWPDGCLLDPVRLQWHGAAGLLTIQRNRADKYRVQYQQEETDPASVLVDPIWIDGGTDHNGVFYPGCWDNHRGSWEVPRGLAAPYYCVATVDPSASNYWAVEFWINHPASEQRFLIDLLRTQMDASEFLDWNANDAKFFGVMEDWQLRSVEMGYPITHWIVETNAAQRYLLQYDHVHRWQRLRGVKIVPHSTGMNKLDPEFGIQSIANRFQFANIRLPGQTAGADLGAGRKAAEHLVTEATRYPSGATDDCLMACWFNEYTLPSLTREVKPMPKLKRPSWMRVPA